MNYSQNNEQEIILNYFGDQKGTFIDIGANDGRTLSNTLALTEGGWAGVLIEPSPTAFKRLFLEYSDRGGYELHNIAIGGFDGDVTLHESGELLGKDDVGLVSSIRPAELKRWESLNMKFTPVKVQQVSWRTFITTKTSFLKFDFLSIDIEGMEIEVLKQMNLRQLGIRLACIEWNSVGFNLYDVIMKRQGYKLIHKNQENLIYGIY